MKRVDPFTIDLDSIILSIKRMYTLTQIPISITDTDGNTIYCLPESEHHFLPILYVKEYIKEFTSKMSDDTFPLFLSRESGVLIGIIKLSAENYLIIGPVTSIKTTWDQMSSYYMNVLSTDEIMVLKRVYETLTPTDSVRFANILSSLIFSIKSVNLLPLEILTKNYIHETEPVETQDYSESIDDKTPFNLPVDNSILFEGKIIEAIKEGNIDNLTDAWKFPAPVENISMPKGSSYSIFFDIPLLTLASRAAIDGGADPVKVMNTFYENMTTITTLKETGSSLAYSIEQSFIYCNLVRQAAGKDLMPSICRECEKYINSHISEKITADDLTKVCGISKRKLYTIFEANFHMTINEYIQKERIKRARFMLDNTNYTTAQISSSLGYATQSYFITIFQKHYHCTPGEYIKKKKDYNLVVH